MNNVLISIATNNYKYFINNLIESVLKNNIKFDKIIIMIDVIDDTIRKYENDIEFLYVPNLNNYILQNVNKLNYIKFAIQQFNIQNDDIIVYCDIDTIFLPSFNVDTLINSNNEFHITRSPWSLIWINLFDWKETKNGDEDISFYSSYFETNNFINIQASMFWSTVNTFNIIYNEYCKMLNYDIFLVKNFPHINHDQSYIKKIINDNTQNKLNIIPIIKYYSSIANSSDFDKEIEELKQKNINIVNKFYSENIVIQKYDNGQKGKIRWDINSEMTINEFIDKLNKNALK